MPPDEERTFLGRKSEELPWADILREAGLSLQDVPVTLHPDVRGPGRYFSVCPDIRDWVTRQLVLFQLAERVKLNPEKGVLFQPGYREEDRFSQGWIHDGKEWTGYAWVLKTFDGEKLFGAPWEAAPWADTTQDLLMAVSKACLGTKP